MKRNVRGPMTALAHHPELQRLVLQSQRTNIRMPELHFALKILSLFLILLLTGHSQVTMAQDNDRPSQPMRFSGTITVTNKGISTIPSFTLGKPAVIFDFSIGRGKFSFEPQFRFALEGKPWSFLFWGRYKLLTGNKFLINLGAHPALSFKTKSYLVNGVSTEALVLKRYLAGDLTPTFILSKKINVGAYYLYSYGVESDIIKHTHFIAARANFTNIKLSDQYSMRFNPQIYYLKTGQQDGFYWGSTLAISKKNCPVSISSLVNKTIESNVLGSKDFIWNVSIIYSFSKRYVAVK